MLPVKLKRLDGAQVPHYATKGAAGMDLSAHIGSDIEVGPLARAIVPTGLFIELPVGYEAQIRSRSGLAAKSGIAVLNSPGTIDADYRGEIKVILINLSNEIFTIRKGDRIAQMVIAKHEVVTWQDVDELSGTVRGEGGLGHTGV